MYFRSQKKLQERVSLSDSIDTDQDGNSLSFMDVIGVDDTMLEDLSASETRGGTALPGTDLPNAAGRDIVEQRYGLDGTAPHSAGMPLPAASPHMYPAWKRSSGKSWAGIRADAEIEMQQPEKRLLRSQGLDSGNTGPSFFFFL